MSPDPGLVPRLSCGLDAWQRSVVRLAVPRQRGNAFLECKDDPTGEVPQGIARRLGAIERILAVASETSALRPRRGAAAARRSPAKRGRAT